MSSASEPARRESTFSLRRVLMVGIPAAALCALVVTVSAKWIENSAHQEGQEVMLSWFGMQAPNTSRLESQFTDTDSDLVADPPKDAAKLVSPETLLFAYVAAPEAGEQREVWKGFVEHLSKKTGKPVEFVAFETTDEQLDALTQGKLHVAGLNTGSVPHAVSSHGFVPVCTLGSEKGEFGTTMRFIVPVGSSVQKVEDLKGRTITFTNRASNSGYKAALVCLRDANLLPQRDYQWRFSGGHDESIAGVIRGEFEAAPVSDDLLQRAAEKDKVRSIYQSERFPPATFGYVYNLEPELAAKVKEAFLEFSLPGSSLDSQLASEGVTKFVPVEYKDDFALVRRIDSAFRKSGTDSAPAVSD